MIEIPAWTINAACAEADPYDFFPDGNGLQVQYAEARAKTICATCPVRLLCLNWQLEFEAGLGPRSRFGVYGGTNPLDRARLDKKAVA